jgi:hypothetical protein
MSIDLKALNTYATEKAPLRIFLCTPSVRNERCDNKVTSAKVNATADNRARYYKLTECN